jgi:hypothetical protein
MLLFKALHVFFGMERLKADDEIFFVDDTRQVGNFIAFHKLFKVDENKFRQAILARAMRFQRLKSKVVFFLGLPFYKLMDDSDIYNNAGKIIVLKSGVHDETALTEFMAKE